MADTIRSVPEVAPIDSIVIASFGGPEGPDEVVPFLRRVTAGRNIPDERLKVVGEHYFHFGGISPINAINRGLRDRLQAELDRRGLGISVYLGNRNAEPFLGDTVNSMISDGKRHALVLATSAYGGYSACRQYHGDIAAALDTATGQMELEKLPQTYHTDAFAQINADAVSRALMQLDGEDPATTRLIFTAHSVPTSANDESGPQGNLYRQQIEVVAAEVAMRVGFSSWDVAWQSRSGAPHVPWLEPDICDHLESIAAEGVTAVVIAPIGFVSDHMEVIWDLDTEAQRKADERGIRMARAATASDDPRFVELYADLIEARIGSGPGVGSFCAPLQDALGVGRNGTPCAVGCCGS